MKVVIAGGGTAGHVFPGVAVGRVLADRGVEVVFVGTRDGPEGSIVAEAGFGFVEIRVSPRGRGLAWKSLVAVARLVLAFFDGRRILKTQRPDVVVGMGGYVSLPLTLAAASRRIPLVIHEQNAVPGLANRVSARFADVVATSFADTDLGKSPLTVGNPVRSEILHAGGSDVSEARRHFGLETARKTVLITGGSQGARNVNEAAIAQYERWRSRGDLQVLHLTGADRYDETVDALSSLRKGEDLLLYRHIGYSDRMELAYATADLVVCRGGATSLAEVAAIGLPAIVIPLPHSLDDDQRLNAARLHEADGAVVIEDSDAKEQLGVQVDELLGDPSRLDEMAANLSSLSRPSSAARLAELILGLPPVPKVELTEWKSPHLMGVAGARMAPLARMLSEAGGSPTGCDITHSAVLERLQEAGIETHVGHSPGHVSGSDALIVSPAIPAGEAEIAEASNLGIEVVTGGEALARLLKTKRTLAIAGTHGKSTTTAMVATILNELAPESSHLIGAETRGLDWPGRLGSGDLAVVEADEAYGSFLHLNPAVATINWLDTDHLDYYGTRERLEEAYELFAESASEIVVACVDDEATMKVTEGAASRLTFGFSQDAEVTALELTGEGVGNQFKLSLSGRVVGTVMLRVPGRHNVLNALSAVATCVSAGLDPAGVARALGDFQGLARRFEYQGEFRGATFYDDYAHLPREIDLTIGTARALSEGRVVVVFQPHLYSRTEQLGDQIGRSLSIADVVIVTGIFGAREAPMPKVSSKLVVDAVLRNHPNKPVALIESLDEAAEFLERQVRAGDLVLTMGAGDVNHVFSALLDA